MRKGQKHSQETIEKIRQKKISQKIIPKTAFKKGYIPWNKGKPAPWTSLRNKLTNSLRTKEKHWNWRGGVSKIDKIIRRMPEYFDWRNCVFERDGYTCVNCGAFGCYITAHHIKPFSVIIKENNIKSTDDARKLKILWDVSNGKTLCELCHSETDNYKGRLKNK